MLKIDDNMNIELTRGDTLVLDIEPEKLVPPVPPATEPTWEPYVPEEGDVIRFAVSKGYKGQSGYELQFKITAASGTPIRITAGPDKTALDYYEYNYDVEITFADGTVDTFISGKFKITGEAE